MPPNTPLLFAFDTSAAHCAVALLCGDRVLASRTEEMSKGQGERLIPLLEEVLCEAGQTWAALDGLAVGIGPGNFTGIRISVSAARGLALGLNVPAIGVSTLEALAYGAKHPTLTCLDARRDRLYVQVSDDMPKAPQMIDWEGLGTLSLPKSTHVYGFRAAEIAALLNCTPGPETETPPPEAFAKVALLRLDHPNDAPAPLYLRAADAAISSTPPLVILHDA